MSISYIADSLPLELQGYGFTFVYLVAGLSFICGGVAGGMIANHFGRNVPFMVSGEFLSFW